MTNAQGNWFVGMPVATQSWFAPLVADAPARVRVFSPDDVHLTVAFLGPCGEARARAAWATMADAVFPPFPVELGALKPMGNPRRPSALSVTISRGHEPVAQLIGELRGPACEAAGARTDNRPPRPHITVARPQRAASPDERRAAVAWAASKAAVGAQLTLGELALYAWAYDRRVRQFRVVAQRGATQTQSS